MKKPFWLKKSSLQYYWVNLLFSLCKIFIDKNLSLKEFIFFIILIIFYYFIDFFHFISYNVRYKYT